MAQKRKTTKKKPVKQAKKNTKQSKKATESASAAQRRRAPGEIPEGGGEILDNTAKRDIAGVCFIVLGIVLMIFVCLPSSDALFNGVASMALHYLLGIGCYVLPIMLIAIGICYLYRPKRSHKISRIAIGLTIIYIALLAIFAMFAPIISLGQDDVGLLFTDRMLIGYGGYIGSVITWAGISFLGRMVTGVLLATLIVIGLIIIGFSISRPIETAKIRHESSEPLTPARHRQQTSGFARVRQAPERDVDVDEIYRRMQDEPLPENFDPDNTNVFDAPGPFGQERPSRRSSRLREGAMADTYPQSRNRAEQEYLELPRPEFLDTLYSGQGGSLDSRTSRLDAPDGNEGNTRRLMSQQDRDRYADGPHSYIESNFAAYANHPILREEEDEEGPLPLAEDEFSESAYGSDAYSGDPYEGAHGYGDDAFSDSGYPTEIDDVSYERPHSPYLDVIGAAAEELPAYSDEGDVDDEPQIRDIYIDGTKTLSIELEDEPKSMVIPSLETIYSAPTPASDATSADELHIVDIVDPIEDAGAYEPAPSPAPAKKASPKKSPKKDSGASASKASPASTGKSSKFRLPGMGLLQKAPKKRKRSDKDLAGVAATLQQTLSDFGVAAEVVDWIAGPTVTLFEVNLPAGVRVSRVTALNDDIALALAAPGIRIFAPVPGTNYVGIEVPNADRETVYLSDVLGSAGEGPLEIAIGKDVEGHAIVSDLAKMPHLLIGGTTGSGKSVAINAMIMSILMRSTPDEVRFILVDPKRVEFTPYNGIPHLYVPVVTEPKEAASALAWGVAEMERRLKIFSGVGARNISQYNEKAKRSNEEADGTGDETDEMEVMPYIVIVIDELADLMMNVGKEVETSISRIAQLARAAGIHLIVATQRPSTNVVTGLIKANITNRIAFNVASSIDSRVILDSTGAENLIGLGDLLLSKPELAKPQRIQACYISESEIEAVVDFVKSQGSPEYHTEILATNTYGLGDTNPSGGDSADMDPLTWEAAEIVVSSGMGSTSNLQRRLKVGYARAGRIMDQLEELGIVGSANGSKPRDVLVDEGELELIRGLENAD